MRNEREIRASSGNGRIRNEWKVVAIEEMEWMFEVMKVGDGGS